MSTVNNPDISLLAAKAGHMGRLTKGGKLPDCFQCWLTASIGPGLRTLGSSVWSHLSRLHLYPTKRWLRKLLNIFPGPSKGSASLWPRNASLWKCFTAFDIRGRSNAAFMVLLKCCNWTLLHSFGHCTSLHGTTLHCTSLHCTTLHCTTMHCNPLESLYIAVL